MVARKDTEYSRTQSTSGVLRALAIVNKPQKSKSITGEGRPRNLNTKDVVSVHRICCALFDTRGSSCVRVFTATYTQETKVQYLK